MLRSGYDERLFESPAGSRCAGWRLAVGPAVSALWADPAEAAPGRRPELRLLQGRRPVSSGPVGAGDGRSPGVPAVEPTLVRTRPQVSGPRHRVPLEVRRRRTLLALLAIGSVAVALPFGGAGRLSHPAGPTLDASGRPLTYVVMPGDTLWTIAERIDPSGDPRPLVARLAARTGSDTVVPGERIELP